MSLSIPQAYDCPSLFLVCEVYRMYDERMTPALQTGLQALSRHFAGRHVRVPLDPDALLLKVPSDLDRASAAAVCAAVGGTRLFCRKQTRTLAEARNSLIRVRRAQGATLQAIADEFGISPRHVSNIIKDTPK